MGRDAPVISIAEGVGHQPKSFVWRARGAKPHPKGQLDSALFDQACAELNQIVTLNA
jgi:mRNA interferase MazF